MKRIIAIILSAVLLAVAVPVISFAEEGSETVYRELNILHKKLWTAGEGVLHISERKASGKDTLYVSAKEGAESLSISADFEPMDLSDFTEICIHIAANGTGEAYPVTLTLSSDTESTTHSLSTDESNTVFYVPLSRSVAEGLSSISISVDAEESNLSYVTVSSAVADDTYTYSYLSLFSATDLTSESTAVKEEDKITLVPSGNAADLTPSFHGYTATSGNTMVWLKLEGGISGSVSVTALYPAKEDKTETHSSLPLTANVSGTYTFVVPSGFSRITFEFSALTDPAPISVLGTGFAYLGESAGSAGSITSCRYDGKRLTVSGTLSTDASLKYIGSKLLLYRIPAESAHSFSEKSLSELKPVAQCSFSTRFSLSLECDEAYATWLYKVVLDTQDGLLPVGGLKCAGSSSVSSGQSGTASALYGADVADVFETNTGSTVIDIYAGKLLDVEDIYSAVNYNYVTQYHFNSEYLSELDESIGFFKAAGIKVYIRISSDKEGYLFDYDPNDRDSLSLMCAVSTFLSKRYGDVEGFIIGSHANGKESTTPKACEREARLISIFAECIKSNNPDASVVVPFLENSEGDLWLSTSLLSYYLSAYGAPSLVPLYEFTDNKSGPVATANRISLIAAQYGAALDGFGVMWDPSSRSDINKISDGYLSLCGESAAYGARISVLNVSKLEKDPALYDSLKTKMSSANISQSTISTYPATQQGVQFTGTYPIWDFTSSYDTKGWVAGGSFSSPISAKGTFSSRALFSETAKNGAGILIAGMDKPLNAKDTCVRITFSISSKESENAEISFIFGTRTSRAEYSANVKCNSPSTLVCDLSDFDGAESIEYAAIIVRNVSDAKTELSMIELCSSSLTHEEMKLKYHESHEFEHNPLLYTLIIFIAAGTVTVFSVLIKKKKIRKDGKNE